MKLACLLLVHVEHSSSLHNHPPTLSLLCNMLAVLPCPTISCQILCLYPSVMPHTGTYTGSYLSGTPAPLLIENMLRYCICMVIERSWVLRHQVSIQQDNTHPPTRPPAHPPIYYSASDDSRSACSIPSSNYLEKKKCHQHHESIE